MYRAPKFHNPYHWSAHHELHESRGEHLREMIGAKRDERGESGALPTAKQFFGFPKIKRKVF